MFVVIFPDVTYGPFGSREEAMLWVRQIAPRSQPRIERMRAPNG